jgi:hypothetical protein
MSSLLVFNRVYRLEIQPVMVVLSTCFVNLLLKPSLCLARPPLPCVNKYTEPVFVDLLGSQGIDSQPGVPVRPPV